MVNVSGAYVAQVATPGIPRGSCSAHVQIDVAHSATAAINSDPYHCKRDARHGPTWYLHDTIGGTAQLQWSPDRGATWYDLGSSISVTASTLTAISLHDQHAEFTRLEFSPSSGSAGTLNSWINAEGDS